ncbi:MAG TPA: hypothetical protein VMB21_19590 [Candidatus Limnocylindria bacterium]|nr:hypothetical protein [Candidatus Limnocylindria bacterium]
MLGTLNLASWGFALGAGGQMAFYWKLLPLVPRWFVALVAFVPWLTVFAISFCNRPLFGPRPMRHCLFFAVAWYAGLTLLAEVLRLVIQSPPTVHFTLLGARVLIYLFGSVSTFVFIRAGIALRRLETASAA